MVINEEECPCSKCEKVKDEVMIKVDLGLVGIGSKFDGSFVRFKICGDCLSEFRKLSPEHNHFVDWTNINSIEYDDFLYDLVRTFPLERQEEIFNSGSNTYLSSEDWIRYEKGEMSDIEKLEMGLSI